MYRGHLCEMTRIPDLQHVHEKQKLRKPWVIYLYILYACAFKPCQQLLYHDVLSRSSLELNVQIGPHYECNYAEPDSCLIPFNKDMEQLVFGKQLTYPTGEVGNIDSTHIVPYWSVVLGEGTGLLEVNDLDEGPLSCHGVFVRLLFGGLLRPKIEDK